MLKDGNKKRTRLLILLGVIFALLVFGGVLLLTSNEDLPPLRTGDGRQSCRCKAPWAVSKDFGDGSCHSVERYSGYRGLPLLHVINLRDERGATRRRHIDRTMRRVGMPYVFSPADDQRKVSDKDHLHPQPLGSASLVFGSEIQRPTQFKLMMGNNMEMVVAAVENDENALLTSAGLRNLTTGEVALVRSHSSLYQKLLNSQEDYILIAEDDINLNDKFVEHLRDLLGKLPPRFDWIKLGGYVYPGWERYGANKTESIAEGKREIVPMPDPVWCCTALYLISREGARLLLRTNNPQRPWRSADGAMELQWLQLISGRKPISYFVSPSLGWQEDDPQIQNSGTHRGDA